MIQGRCKSWWLLLCREARLDPAWLPELAADPLANLLAIAPFPLNGPQRSPLFRFRLIPNLCGELSNVNLHWVHGGFLLMMLPLRS